MKMESEHYFSGFDGFWLAFPYSSPVHNITYENGEKGDILLSVRAPVGDMNIANADCCIGRGLAVLNSKAAQMDFYST